MGDAITSSRRRLCEAFSTSAALLLLSARRTSTGPYGTVVRKMPIYEYSTVLTDCCRARASRARGICGSLHVRVQYTYERYETPTR